MVFERKVLRKIFGPTKERDGTWRIKTNDELVKHKNIIKHMKAQRLSWFGHLHRMPEERIVTKYTSGNRCQYDHKADQRTDGKTECSSEYLVPIQEITQFCDNEPLI